MTPDSELLRRFARTNSEDAFAELVKRHVNLVYSAALRQVGGDAHLAQDVAQSVFTDLVRKARALSRRESLTGWLYTSAHFAAAKIARTENRRRDREEKFMREPIHETAPEPDWEKLRPVLDDAMHEIKAADREAILLRYFENRPFAEVGAKLGLNENAARMRVERALEKLRGIFTERGITTATALASVISVNAIQIAPANLAATLTTTSIATVGTGTFTLLKIMTMAKLKLGISTLVVAGAATALVIQHQAQTKLNIEKQSLRQQLKQLQTDNESLSNHLAAIGEAKSLTDEQLNELLRLRGEVGVLRRQTNEFGKLREENQQLHTGQDVTKEQMARLLNEVQNYVKLHQIDAHNALKIIGLATRRYADDHGGRYPTNFDQIIDDLDGSTNFGSNIRLDDFEFVNAGLPSERYPQMIIFRQRFPVRTENGKWSRVYGTVDGSVLTETSADGNFDDFERQHVVLPPNQ